MNTRQERWDLEVDLVCVGSGLGGVAAAIVNRVFVVGVALFLVDAAARRLRKSL